MLRRQSPVRRLAWLSLMLGGLVLLLPRDAAACTTCATDADCARGFTCEGFCMPGPCQADTDCSPGMRCLPGTVMICTDGGCTTAGTCSPVWQAGCAVDADCGAGFQCSVGGTVCGKDGCLATGMCVTTLEVPCEADADCPSCWSCSAEGYVACIGTVEPPDAGAPIDAGAPVKMCRPPYVGLGAPSYVGPGPGADAPPPTSACGGTGAGTTVTAAGCALGAGGGAASWVCLAALTGAGLWSAGRRRGRAVRGGAAATPR